MIRSVVNIAAPRSHVFSILTDVDRYPEWMPGCSFARVLGSDDRFINSELILQNVRKVKFFIRFEIQSDQSLLFRLNKGSDFRRYQGSWRTFDSKSGDSTVVIGEIDFDPGGVIPKFMAAGMVRSSIDETCIALKRRAIDLQIAEADDKEDIEHQVLPREQRILHVMKLVDGYRICLLGRTHFIKTNQTIAQLLSS